jgi:hypothetical protein
VLDAEIGLGEIRVAEQRDDFDFRDGDFGRFDDEDFSESRDERAVCEGTGERASG